VGQGGRKWTGAKTDIVADATCIPVEDASLDFLFAAHLFEHLIDPVLALKEWGRVLKPNGVLYATMPSHERTDTMVIDSSHVHAMTPESAKNLLESLGWSVDWCEHFDRSIAFGLVARKPGE
jgi:ubiquinone/menaquinone biosynthesis C-methylase UbiE